MGEHLRGVVMGRRVKGAGGTPAVRKPRCERAGGKDLCGLAAIGMRVSRLRRWFVLRWHFEDVLEFWFLARYERLLRG